MSEPEAGGSPPAGPGSAPSVGPSPAPGAGSPSTRPKLGRTGVVLIVVIGTLWFLGWIAWAIFGPSIEVEVREHRDRPHRGRDEPHGPGRLTLTTPDQLSKPSPSRSSVRSHNPIRPESRSAAASRFRVNWTIAQRSGSGGNGTGFVRT